MGNRTNTEKIRDSVRYKMMNSYNEPANLRKALMDTMKWVSRDDSVVVFMSAGIDSHVCLFACLDLGLKVSLTSFTLDTHESTDFKAAKHAAEVFGLKFHPVVLDSSEEHLKKWVKFAVRKLGLSGKSLIECSWPLYVSIAKLPKDTKHIVLGLGGDSYYLMAKSVSMHCKDLVKETRRRAFRRALPQNELVKREAFARGIYAHMPFFEMGRVYTELECDTDYKILNTPQKALTNQAWPEYRKKCKVRAHQNFQLGDTNISGNFTEKLLQSDWNIRNSKSVVAIYNDVVNGKL